MKSLSSCGNFEIKQDEGSDCVWLYWFGKPIKHLTNKEFSDLELLLSTTIF